MVKPPEVTVRCNRPMICSSDSPRHNSPIHNAQINVLGQFLCSRTRGHLKKSHSSRVFATEMGEIGLRLPRMGLTLFQDRSRAASRFSRDPVQEITASTFSVQLDQIRSRSPKRFKKNARWKVLKGSFSTVCESDCVRIGLTN